MSLIREQALVTVDVKGRGFAEAPAKIREALEPYRDARIISITRKTDWMGSFGTPTSLLIVIEHTPSEAESQRPE